MLKKINTPKIETQRLRLRKVEDSDVEDLFHLYQDDPISRYRPWFPFQNLRQTKEYIQKRIYPVYEREIGYYYVIESKADQKVIGFITLMGIDENVANAELEYGLLKEYWEDGYALEATNALIKMAQEQGFESISASQNTQAPRCGELMRKAGMKHRYSFMIYRPNQVRLEYEYYRINF